MLRFFMVLFSLFFFGNALSLQKPKIYTDQNISGWMISEKLDGIRGYWDGKNLRSRQNQVIHAPTWFVKDLPPFELDGELWSKRGDFENIQSIVMDEEPGERWKQIKYMIFEVPHADGNFTQRLQKAQSYIETKKIRHVEIIDQRVCHDKKELDKFLKEVVAKGGEGVVLKDGSKNYFEGRSGSVLKVKPVRDMEGVVVGYKEGSGKYKRMMGSLKVKLENGIEFFIGSGFSDAQRKNPPKIGEVVTFKYYGFTKKGKPKFASFMRVRKD